MWCPWYKQYQLHCLNFAKSRAEGRFNWWDLSESNPFRPFSCPSNISPAAKLHIFTYSQGDSLSKSIQTTSRNWVICFEINNSQILVRKLKSPYKEKKINELAGSVCQSRGKSTLRGLRFSIHIVCFCIIWNKGILNFNLGIVSKYTLVCSLVWFGK